MFSVLWAKRLARFRECCRQVQEEVVTKSKNKIHQTWPKSFSRLLRLAALTPVIQNSQLSSCNSNEEEDLRVDSFCRGPVVRFANIGEMHRCKKWLEDEDNFALVKAHFDSTSRFARLRRIKAMASGRDLFIQGCNSIDS